jgi:very-short-patch-repair endonuclease
MAVWLSGARLQVVDHIRIAAVVLPDSLAQLAVETIQDDSAIVSEGSLPGSALRFAPLAGVPRADSHAELRLERALSPHDWAQGRQWNRTFEWHLLGKQYRLDLFWPGDGVIVEVDGPEHRGRLQYADDRRRDVQLQLLGHSVLRFTNEQVLSDVGAVTARIEQLLRTRRAAGQPRSEERQHAEN